MFVDEQAALQTSRILPALQRLGALATVRDLRPGTWELGQLSCPTDDLTETRASSAAECAEAVELLVQTWAFRLSVLVRLPRGMDEALRMPIMSAIAELQASPVMAALPVFVVRSHETQGTAPEVLARPYFAPLFNSTCSPSTHRGPDTLSTAGGEPRFSGSMPGRAGDGDPPTTWSNLGWTDACVRTGKAHLADALAHEAAERFPELGLLSLSQLSSHGILAPDCPADCKAGSSAGGGATRQGSSDALFRRGGRCEKFKYQCWAAKQGVQWLAEGPEAAAAASVVSKVAHAPAIFAAWTDALLVGRGPDPSAVEGNTAVLRVSPLTFDGTSDKFAERGAQWLQDEVQVFRQLLVLCGTIERAWSSGPWDSAVPPSLMSVLAGLINEDSETFPGEQATRWMKPLLCREERSLRSVAQAARAHRQLCTSDLSGWRKHWSVCKRCAASGTWLPAARSHGTEGGPQCPVVKSELASTSAARAAALLAQPVKWRPVAVALVFVSALVVSVLWDGALAWPPLR